jgi:hypothetical protein
MRTGRPHVPGFPIGTQFLFVKIVGVHDVRRPDGYVRQGYDCECQCGAPVYATKSGLRMNPAFSCRSCAGKASAYARGDDGRSRTPEWLAWKSMRERCTRESHPAYSRYGGRGIGVCASWWSFDNFLADMGLRPSDKHSLERKDNNAGYEPGNCTWATAREQNRNQRTNRAYTVNGETKLLAEWAEALGTRSATIWNRMIDGWSIEAACTTPVRYKAPNRRRAKVRHSKT